MRALSNVFRVEGGCVAALGDAVDARQEIFDDVFKLALAFNDVAYALEALFLRGALNENDGVALSDMVEVEALRGFGLDAYAVDGEVEKVSDTGTYLTCNGGDFGCGKDKRSVDVDDAVASVVDLFKSEIEKDRGIGVLPAWVARGEEAANITSCDCAEKSVGDGVEENVAVRVASEAFRVVEG